MGLWTPKGRGFVDLSVKIPLSRMRLRNIASSSRVNCGKNGILFW